MQKIIIIDDSEADGQLNSFILSHLGYDITVFQSPGETLKKIYDIDPDCVICDYHMPDMNGADFLAHIRKNGRMYPVIFLTADTSREILLKVFRLGAADVVLKGQKPKELEESLRRVLEMESLRAQIYSATDEVTQKKLKRLLGFHFAIQAKKTS